MGKRSDFDRIPRDFYPTPVEAIKPLMPFLYDYTRYYEPCYGEGDLVRNLISLNSTIECMGYSDYEKDATKTQYDMTGIDCFITNPPWDRKILHPMIDNLRNQAPTWLLFDADWMHTKQSSEYIKFCDLIVSVGRVKWIPGSKMTGKDNCAWYRFQPTQSHTRFIGR